MSRTLFATYTSAVRGVLSRNAADATHRGVFGFPGRAAAKMAAASAASAAEFWTAVAITRSASSTPMAVDTSSKRD
jgi:hypothetical protein